jgi:hypothetical protein
MDASTRNPGVPEGPYQSGLGSLAVKQKLESIAWTASRPADEYSRANEQPEIAYGERGLTQQPSPSGLVSRTLSAGRR